MKLFQFLFDPVALQGTEIIHEQFTIQMVHLVLDADRQQATGLDIERLAIAANARIRQCSMRSTSS